MGSDESDEDFVPPQSKSNNEDDTENDTQSTGAPEPEVHRSIEFDDNNNGADNDDGTANDDNICDDDGDSGDESEDDDFDDSFENLALRSAFKWGMPLDGKVVGFLCVGPHHYQILLRQGYEGGYRCKIEAGSGHAFEKNENLDLARPQSGDLRVNHTREYGKENARRFETKRLNSLCPRSAKTRHSN